MSKLRSEVAQAMDLGALRYSVVWEDSALLDRGLRIVPNDDVLSITSGGDNVLALLLQEPRSVTAIDMSGAQSALLELKLASIRLFEHADLACLFGALPGDRADLYAQVRDRLPEGARAYWDDNVPTIAFGLLEAGRLETYIAGFARDHLPELWPDDLFDRLLDAPSLKAQAALFEAEGLTADFEHRFRWYFGREMMARNGRDPAQFVHVKGGDVGLWFFTRFCWACTHTSLCDNFYVQLFCSGRYRDLSAGPAWLRPRNLRRLRGLVDRVEVVTGELESLLEGSPVGRFSKANLSDVFEYMSEELSERFFGVLATTLRRGGRVAFWNLLVPRTVPEALHDRLRPLPELSRSLWTRDRAWFYRDFIVAQRSAR